MSGFNYVKIRPFQSSPSFLGGGTATPPNSAIASLKRVQSLPRLRKLPKGVDKATKAIYTQLAGGTFDAGWKVFGNTLIINIYAVSSDDYMYDRSNGSDTGERQKQLREPDLPEPSSMTVRSIVTELRSSHGIESTSYLERCELVSALTDARKSIYGNGNFVTRIIFWVVETSFGFRCEVVETKFNKRFHHTIPKDGTKRLTNRLIHLFLRRSGSALPHSWAPELSSYLVGRRGTSQLPMAMDMAAAITDIYCSKSNRDEQLRYGMTLIRAGEVLEANGEYFAAKDVYVLTAENCPCPYPSYQEPEWHLFVLGNAGLALKRAADSTWEMSNAGIMELLYQAEELYIRAWSVYVTMLSGKMRRIGDINREKVRLHLTNMMVLYSSIDNKSPLNPNEDTGECVSALNGSLHHADPKYFEKRGDEKSSIATEDESMVLVLGCLLYAAGLRDVTGLTYDLVLGNGPRHVDILKSEFRTIESAKELLSKALRFSPGSPSNGRRHFRDTLLGAVANVTIWRRGKSHEAVAWATSVQPKEKAKDIVQGNVDFFEALKESYDIDTCDGPGCGTRETNKGEKLFQCPCRVVYYCCKECQLSHWPTHKRTCTHHKKNKKERRKKKTVKGDS